MKEHPITMSTDMVKAILEGRKTQTRRIIKPQPLWISDGIPITRQGLGIRCPYGKVGDRLWVRESYYTGHMPRWASRITLEITGIRAERLQEIMAGDVIEEGTTTEGMRNDWLQFETRPSINLSGVIPKDYMKPIYKMFNDFAEKWYVMRFGHLWDSINAKRGYSWESNPWVWVIEFKKL